MTPLSITAQTTYAELVDQLVALDARRSMGSAPGTFVEKTLASGTYVYFQFSGPGGSVKQVYLGKKSPSMDALVRRASEGRAAFREDRASIESICAALRGAGAAVTDASSARVLAALADSGVFRLGGVLVGTHAFIVLGNVLGVRWGAAAARTEDVDVAAERRMEVAVPELEADVPRALDALGMGFLPVPAFSPGDPSTSFKVRGRGLRVDLVTPKRREVRGPIPIRRFNAAAAPVPFLELVIDDAQPAAVVNGGGVLVNVPQPGRFAVHKLLVAQDRPAAFQAKARKDVLQAARVVEALAELRPGDVREAIESTKGRGKRWRTALDDGLRLLEKVDAQAARRVRPGRP
jgi:hypothetical protein